MNKKLTSIAVAAALLTLLSNCAKDKPFEDIRISVTGIKFATSMESAITSWNIEIDDYDWQYQDYFLYLRIEPYDAIDRRVQLTLNNSDNAIDCDIYNIDGNYYLFEKFWDNVQMIRFRAANMGTAVITATTLDGDYAATCTINVVAPHIVALEMISVQGGTFTMGCTAEQGDDCSGDENPAHQVTLSSFYIGKYEVTNAQWDDIMYDQPNYSYERNQPKANVTWDEIHEFIDKLSTKAGKQYRLPTEAEWEYAARGGAQSQGYKYSGSNDVYEVAWTWHAYSGTEPVGTKNPNELGIYDMSGNVSELCSDWYDYDYYANSPPNNPKGPADGSNRVLRGGSYNSYDDGCRVTSRSNMWASSSLSYVGFRVAHD